LHELAWELDRIQQFKPVPTLNVGTFRPEFESLQTSVKHFRSSSKSAPGEVDYR